jgi:SAM-dependent methyltransferase
LCPLVLDYICDWEGVFAEFFRVLRPAGLLIFSVEHPFTKFLLHGGRDYFATELVEVEWRGFGVPVQVPSYWRPLGAMISALAEAGFVIERIIEPRPIEELKDKEPEVYELLSKRPGFLCVRARKEMSENRPLSEIEQSRP